MLQILLRFVTAFLLTASGVSTSDNAQEPKHVKKFIRYTDCEFLDTPYADGDSFRMIVDGHERVLRLYFVDAPESDTRFPDRNAEQAEYFGITPEQSVAAGKAAKVFVHDLLLGKKVTVFTRWASALGSSRMPRFYAIVEVDGRNLADLLVENGFARLHGTSVTLPDGTKAAEYLAGLRGLEASAREAKRGAWEHSVPAKAMPVVAQVKAGDEPTGWLERMEFTGIGAGGMGLAWGLAHRKSLKRRRNAAGIAKG